jgi:subtilisin-like proprotein convertase family protein
MKRRNPSSRWWLILAAAGIGAALSAAPGWSAEPAHLAAATPAEGRETLVIRTFGNAAPIPIPTAGPSSLYPSPVSVSDVPGTITEMAVNIEGLSHTWPDDIDIMLVSPAGTRVMLQGDAGGSFAVTGIHYQVWDGNPAVQPLPDTTSLAAQTVWRPRDYTPNPETMPEPAPGGVYYVTTSAFRGENPNGVWNLYVRDDSSSDSGVIAGGWQLVLVAAEAAVPTAIPDHGTATPYPSVTPYTIYIPGGDSYSDRITKVRVKLYDMSHTWPDDVDILLQGPGGQTVVLMSDAGGSGDMNDVDLVFDDDASVTLPDDAQIVSGTYRPTNYGTVDNFPAPAPAGPYGTALSVFRNTTPFGDWRLYAVDDFTGYLGDIENWGLEVKFINKGDFDLDSHVDLLWRHDISGENVLWYLDEAVLRDGEFTTPAVLTDVRWKMVGTHDFNNDNRTDILWRHSTSGENVVWLMNKNALISGTFTVPAAMTDVRWQMAGTGDFNGDARPDILWRHDVSGENVVWYMNGVTLVGGTFTNPSSLTDVRWKMVGTGYFNGDDQLDILWWHNSSGQAVVWFMNGVTMTGGQFLSPNGLADTRWRPVATGDMELDGRVDIVWRHQTSGQNAIWCMGGATGTTLVDGELTDPPLTDASWKIVGPR